MNGLAPSIIGLAALLLLGVGSARAEDPPADDAATDEDFIDIEMPETLPLPTSSWYVRADAAYRFYNDPAGAGGGAPFASETLDEARAIGIGVGYRIGDMARVDATLDYAFGTGLSANAGAEAADLSAWTGLINVYADLGTVFSLTPYVGGGIGGSYLLTDDVVAAGAAGSGEGTWNLAWALAAGVAYEVADGVSVDLGYRYLDLGDAKSGGGRSWDNIRAHEVRIGLRYAFD